MKPYFLLNHYTTSSWINNGYPEDKLHKLKERADKCKEMMKESNNKEENLWDYFQLSYPANKKVPWIVDSVDIYSINNVLLSCL